MSMEDIGKRRSCTYIIPESQLGERGYARQEGLRTGRRKEGGLMQRESERKAGRAGDFNLREIIWSPRINGTPMGGL